jgi:hypothetical protein
VSQEDDVGVDTGDLGAQVLLGRIRGEGVAEQVLAR